MPIPTYVDFDAAADDDDDNDTDDDVMARYSRKFHSHRLCL